MTERIVVIGVGNAWRHDDGVGLDVVRRARPRLPSGVEIVELDGEPARVVEAWDGAALAVLVDGVRTGASPGTLHRIEPADTSLPRSNASSHALGPAEAYRLGSALGRLPDRLVVLGIEVETVGPGFGLSPGVAAGAARAVDEVLAITRPAPVAGGD